MWTENHFKAAYTKYDLDSRKEYLENRTKCLMNKYHFGKNILLYGGALGWGGLPLLKEGKFVYNYDTSEYIYKLADFYNEPLKPFNILPEKYRFNTIFFEDSLVYYTGTQKIQYITECLRYRPCLIILLENSEEIVISEELNENIVNGLNYSLPDISVNLEYYNTKDFKKNT